MGRKSLAQERRSQILEAFEECIVEEGLDGTSIAMIAAAAGMDRTLVHHYFGNREALVAALIEQLTEVHSAAKERVVSGLPPENRPRVLLDYIFGPEFADPRGGVIFDELFAAANRSASTRAMLLRDYELFEQVIRGEIEKAYPEAAPARQRRVAYSILLLAETSSRFNRLGFPKTRRRDARASAEALLETLEPPRAG